MFVHSVMNSTGTPDLTLVVEPPNEVMKGFVLDLVQLMEIIFYSRVLERALAIAASCSNNSGVYL